MIAVFSELMNRFPFNFSTLRLGVLIHPKVPVFNIDCGDIRQVSSCTSDETPV